MFQTTNQYVYIWLPKGQCFFGIINPILAYLGCFSFIWVGLCQAMDWRIREHVRLKLVRISTLSYLNMFLSCIFKTIIYQRCRIKVLMFCLLTPFTGSHQSLPPTLLNPGGVWDRGGHLPFIFQNSLLSAWIHQKRYVAVRRCALLFFPGWALGIVMFPHWSKLKLTC